MTSKNNVANFLKEFKVKMNIFSILFVSRSKNIQALADLDITPKERESILDNLKVEDYSEGPLEENQFGGAEMWVFGITVKSQEVYVKITLGMENSHTICISFHLSEYSMNYPFKN